MYKPVIFSVLILCINTCQSTPESQVKALIQKVHDAIPEPINIPHSKILVPENKYISGFLNLSNLEATGLKAFELKVNFLLFGLIPKDFNFRLNKLELNTSYLVDMPLFNWDLLKIFGLGNVHLSLSDLSMNGSISINLSHPVKNLKLNLGSVQFGITGLLNDPDLNKELSEDISESIAETVNNHDFALLVENVINSIAAKLFKKGTTTEVSTEEANNGMASVESLGLIDLLKMFTIWIEEVFRDYRNQPEIEDSLFRR